LEKGWGKKTKKLFISDFWEKGEKKDFIFFLDKKIRMNEIIYMHLFLKRKNVLLLL